VADETGNQHHALPACARGDRGEEGDGVGGVVGAFPEDMSGM
jgi:hypothetical protein